MDLHQAYRAERAIGFQAKWALSNARTRLDWAAAGDDVRLLIVPDECCDPTDFDGSDRDKRKVLERANRDGCWGVVGQYWSGDKWVDCDSCFGFVGDEWKNSGADTDIMRATLDARRDYLAVLRIESVMFQ